MIAQSNTQRSRRKRQQDGKTENNTAKKIASELSFFTNFQPASAKARKVLKKDLGLYRKLITALKFTKNTCVIGASNQFDKIKKTNAWSFTSGYRYACMSGEYRKWSKQPFEKNDLSFFLNAQFLENKTNSKLTHSNKNEWYYYTHSSMQPSVQLQARSPRENPLGDPKFNLEGNQIILLKKALLTREIRVGNCGDQTAVLIKYLWENSIGITRIELIALDFDHCIIVINRKGNKGDYKTWGDALCIDPWYRKGIIFHAEEFEEKVNKIKTYMISNKEKLNNLSIGTRKIKSNPFSFQVTIEIKPNIQKYPTYSTQPFLALEHYYCCTNIYPLGENERLLKYQKRHKSQFVHSLNKIQLYGHLPHGLLFTLPQQESKLKQELQTVGLQASIIHHICANNGLVLFQENILKPADLVNTNDELIQVLISFFGIQALREKLMSADQVIKMDDTLALKCLFSKIGLSFLRQKLINPSDLVNMLGYTAKAIFTHKGIRAFEEKLITVDQALKIKYSFILNLLFSKPGIKALRNHLVIPEEFVGLNLPNAEALIRSRLEEAELNRSYKF